MRRPMPEFTLKYDVTSNPGTLLPALACDLRDEHVADVQLVEDQQRDGTGTEDHAANARLRPRPHRTPGDGAEQGQPDGDQEPRIPSS